eukprot:3413597-Prymnesium_polylepis.4
MLDVVALTNTGGAGRAGLATSTRLSTQWLSECAIASAGALLASPLPGGGRGRGGRCSRCGGYWRSTLKKGEHGGVDSGVSAKDAVPRAVDCVARHAATKILPRPVRAVLAGDELRAHVTVSHGVSICRLAVRVHLDPATECHTA